ncbi:AtzH-like domain-containing protein [Salipiger thiooxidans]|uniref:AtzH-like domain-containing protein n=1 Tax=Salipiger thiooxidans TaxID=282683 RepID=UPI001CD1EC19|nr:AtzH-like domain-containing protein [Salipiger thiooxidans]MCA0850146.1 nuclear transport factor 2 family protein [Salipiger thiooxidans]
MEDFDRASVEALIRTRIKACEAALEANDVDRLVGFFWDDPRAVRFSAGGGLYGHDQIASFRKGRDVSDIARELSEVRITAFSADFGTATCEYRRLDSSRRGARGAEPDPDAAPGRLAHRLGSRQPRRPTGRRRPVPVGCANLQRRVRRSRSRTGKRRDARAAICLGPGTFVGLGVVGRGSRFLQHTAPPV